MAIVVGIVIGAFVVFVVVKLWDWLSSFRTIAFRPSVDSGVHLLVGQTVTATAALVRKRARSLSDFTIPGDRTIRFSVVDALAGKFLIVGGDPLNVQTTGGTANVQIEGDSPGESGLVASATSHQPSRSYGPVTLPVYVWANEAAFTTYKTDHGKDHWELMTPDGQGEEQE